MGKTLTAALVEDFLLDFYRAFNNHDHVAMNANYADDATFEDPAFGPLSCTYAEVVELMNGWLRATFFI